MKLFTVAAGTPAMLVGDHVLRVWEVPGDRIYGREDLVLDQVILHNDPDWNKHWEFQNQTVALMERMAKMGKMFFPSPTDEGHRGRACVAVDQNNVGVLA